MDLGLKDKRALVIGASRGLGYATALLLAKEGCRVAINGRDEAKVKAAAEKISKETGASVTGVAGDVSDPSVPEKTHRASRQVSWRTRSPRHQRGRTSSGRVRIRSMKPHGRKRSIFRS